MSTKIKGAEYPLAKIFSSDFDLRFAISKTIAWTRKKREIKNCSRF